MYVSADEYTFGSGVFNSYLLGTDSLACLESPLCLIEEAAGLDCI